MAGWGNLMGPACCCSGGGGGGGSCVDTICFDVNGCSTLSGLTISVTDPSSHVTSSSSTPYCLEESFASGTFTFSTSATGYFPRTGDTYSFSCPATEPTITIDLTPTTVGVYSYNGCSGPLVGGTVSLSGAVTGSCVTNSTGSCTISLSNELNAGDSYTITVSKSPRYATTTNTYTCATGTNLYGCTALCGEIEGTLSPASAYFCCSQPNCDPVCKTINLSTPFGNCTQTITSGSSTVTCQFTKVVTGWVYLPGSEGEGTLRSSCGISGYTRTSVSVTFTVVYNVCAGTVVVYYTNCGGGCTANACEDPPPGSTYGGGGLSGSCSGPTSGSGSGICPPTTTTSSAIISGTPYCDGTYTVTESCGTHEDSQAPESLSPVQEPGLLAKAASFAKAAAAHVADGMRKASDEVQAEREAICRACPLLDQAADKCSLCGCSMMGLKRSWASSECPDGKWPAV